ncbi:class I SAM-dependent methyltransferase [Nocardia sp. NPDC051570]|uniref:class I SAM-dependent methyltransferase n=1 Tax=Nocardia sp. NPDC051570 TaxID=3364324 RepID=UPI0037B0DFAD
MAQNVCFCRIWGVLVTAISLPWSDGARLPTGVLRRPSCHVRPDLSGLEATIAQQSRSLDQLIRSAGHHNHERLLDVACGIGTQALGIAQLGYDTVAADLSSVAAQRARTEAQARGVPLRVVAADMRSLPFPAITFDIVVCADNALPHLLNSTDVIDACEEMLRVLRPGGLLLLTVRDYDALRRTRPCSTRPQTHNSASRRMVTFQLWDWTDDGEHYDLELFQLASHGEQWITTARRTRYWAMTRDQITEFAHTAGFESLACHVPEQTGFFQPVLTGRRP